jgi:hypothetical protein
MRKQRSLEVKNVLHVAKNALAVLCVHHVYWVSQHDNNSRVWTECSDFSGGSPRSKIRGRSFPKSALTSSARKTTQVFWQCSNASLMTENVIRKKLRFFDRTHENIGMAAQIGVQCSCSTLWAADNEEVRLGLSIH